MFGTVTESGEELAVAGVPGTSSYNEYGERCKEGVSTCCEFDGDGSDVWTDVGFGGWE